MKDFEPQLSLFQKGDILKWLRVQALEPVCLDSDTYFSMTCLTLGKLLNLSVSLNGL